MATSEDRDLVEILAAYITTYTLQTLYVKAKELKEKREAPTITDGYVISLDRYKQLLKTDDWFRKQVDSIVATYDSYNIQGIKNVMDRWARLLTPKDYWDSLSDAHKLIQFKNMFLNTVFKFIDHIKITPNLRNIIDNRHDKTIPGEYKNIYKKFVDEERDLIYKKFARARTGKEVPTTTSQERIELRKATEVITKLKNLNTKFINEVEICNKKFEAEALKNRKLLQEHKNALMKIKLLETEITELKQKKETKKKSVPVPDPVKAKPASVSAHEPAKPISVPTPEPETTPEPEPASVPNPENPAEINMNLEEFGDYFNE